MHRNSFAILSILGLLGSCVSHDTVSPQAQLKIDTIAIRNFLSQNSSATKIDPGVWYEIDTLGNGIFPVLTDSITVSYSTRRIPSLNEYDTAVAVRVLLSSVLSGWQLALVRFPVGSYGKLYIPSGLGFGLSQNGLIPPNTNLLYRIKLTGIKGVQFSNDTTAIRTYVNTIIDSLVLTGRKPVKDISGILYSYDSSAITSSVRPDLTKSVTITFTTNLLNSKTYFINATDSTVLLKDQIAAWRNILPKIKEGGQVTIYVPSGYGYGSSQGPHQIPINSNLVYQVKLNHVN